MNKLRKGEPHILYISQNIVRVMNSRRIRGTGMWRVWGGRAFGAEF